MPNKNLRGSYNKIRVCDLCGKKIGDAPTIEPHGRILHESCWNETFD